MPAVHWTIPADGPCAGHRCDNCPTCQKGHCCRSDDPDYRLPALGDWEGPLHAPLGRLEEVGDSVVCHVCGVARRKLSAHIWAAHDLPPDEYRALFGLKRGTGLVGPALRAAMAARERERLRSGDLSGPEHLERLQRGRLRISPERQSALSSRRPRLEVFLQAGTTSYPCVICGEPFVSRRSRYVGTGRLPNGVTRRMRTTCGRPECRAELRSRVHKGRRLTAEQRERLSELARQRYAAAPERVQARLQAGRARARSERQGRSEDDRASSRADRSR